MQVQAGSLFRHTLVDYTDEEAVSLSVGGFYRSNDAVVPVVRLDYMKFGLGMSYDINISHLKAASQFRGGLEVTLSYRSYLNMMNTALNKVRCVVPFW